MIPKTIHYCWFGGNQMPSISIKCISSWKIHLTDYELKLWDENSFDINSNRFCKEAYICKKYAFVADYVRLFALYHYGGVYMDTDVEILKNIDEFLTYPAFSGFDSENDIPTGIIGSEKHGLWVQEQLSYYNNLSFIRKNGGYNIKTNVKIMTENASKYNFIPNNEYQIINNYLHIFPMEYFCPKSYNTRRIDITSNTYCIHHFTESWRKDSSIEAILKKYFGKKYGKRIIMLANLLRKPFLKAAKIKQSKSGIK